MRAERHAGADPASLDERGCGVLNFSALIETG
jgi:hypothetical protein